MSDQENKQSKQNLPADPAEQPKPAPKPSPEKRPEKQAPPPVKITAPASKKVKNPKRVAAGKALAAKNKEKLAKIKAFEESELVKQDQQTSEAIEGKSNRISEATSGAIKLKPRLVEFCSFSCWRSSRCWRAISIWIPKMDSVSKPAD